ncbi:MAG: ABC transporter permease subunit [Acidimicrobiales bacterium]
MSPAAGREAREVAAGYTDAHIHDRGYRRYDGIRSGVSGAVWSVARHSLRATLGLGRSARHKVFPVAAAVIAYLPAVVFAGMAALFDVDLIGEEILPDYFEYYGFIGMAIVLFVALVTPEVLVGDRRNGLLGLYLSTPLERWSYLVAKAIAVTVGLAIVTLGPLLVLLVAYTFEGAGPDGVLEWFRILGKIVVSGVAVSAALSAVSLAAASVTDRRAFASVGIILLMLGSAAVVGGLVDGAGMSDTLRVFDVFSLPFELVNRIWSEPGEFPELSTPTVLAANAAWTLLGAAIVWGRYRRLAVSR